MSRRADVSTAAIERSAKATVSRHIHFLWALTVYPAVWLLGLALWLFWGRSDGLVYIASLLTAVGIALTWWIGFNSYRRQKGTHVMWAWYVLHTILTTSGASVWAVWAMIEKPWSHPLIDLYFILGGVLAVSWVARLHYERADAQAHTNGQPSARSAAQALMAAHGLDGVDGRVVENNDQRLELELDLTGSDVLVEDVVDKVPHLAKDFDKHRRMVTVIPSDDGETTAKVRVMKINPLGESQPWPGPSRPGGTPFDPVRTGVREDGTAGEKIVASPDGVYHEISNGMTGSGKGFGAIIESMELMSRREVRQIVLDPIKGVLTFGRLAAGLDMLLITHRDVNQFIRKLPKWIYLNNQYLASRKLPAWEPGCGIPLTIIWFQELSEYNVDWGLLNSVGKTGRAAGFGFKLDLQSAQHHEMPVTLRRQIGSSVTYGVNDDFDENLLPTAIQESHRSPVMWRNHYPGMCYEIAPGTTREQQMTPMRKFNPGRDWALCEQYAAEWGPKYRMPDDKIAAAALGAMYTQRVHPLEVVRQATSPAASSLVDFGSAAGRPVAKAATPATPPPAAQALAGETDDDEEDEDMPADDLSSLTQAELGVTAPDPMPEVDDSEAVEMDLAPPSEDVRLGTNAPPSASGAVSDKEMEVLVRQKLIERLHELHNGGEDFVTAPQFTDAIVNSGLRSRPWVHKQLKSLQRQDFLKWSETESAYEILALPPMPNVPATA